MADVFTISCNNTAASQKKLDLSAIGFLSNYGDEIPTSSGSQKVYARVNTTANGPAPERVQIKRSIVNNPTVLLDLPAKDLYADPSIVRLEHRVDLKVTHTDSADPTLKEVAAPFCQITFGVPKGFISDEVTDVLLKRTLSSFFEDDGTSRIARELKGAVQVTAD